MKQTRKMAIALGYGSNECAARRVQENILENTDYDNVVVFSLDDGMRRPDDVAEAADGADFWTHSDGAEAGDQALSLHSSVRPNSVNMVGAPIPTRERSLYRAAAVVVYHEVRSSLESKDNARTNALRIRDFVQEFGRHPLEQTGVIRRISRYDSFEFGNRLTMGGIATQMCWTEQDEVFRVNSPAFQQRLVTKHPKLKVVSMEGRHCDFTHKTADVMGRIATARLVIPQTTEQVAFSGSLELSQGLVPA